MQGPGKQFVSRVPEQAGGGFVGVDQAARGKPNQNQGFAAEVKEGPDRVQLGNKRLNRTAGATQRASGARRGLLPQGSFMQVTTLHRTSLTRAANPDPFLVGRLPDTRRINGNEESMLPKKKPRSGRETLRNAGRPVPGKLICFQGYHIVVSTSKGDAADLQLTMETREGGLKGLASKRVKGCSSRGRFGSTRTILPSSRRNPSPQRPPFPSADQ